MLTELTRKHMEENASLARNQEAYQERYNDLLARYTAATERIRELRKLRKSANYSRPFSQLLLTKEKTGADANEFKESFG